MHELLETVRATVDRGIDWLLDRAIAGGQALIALARRGVAAVRGWWDQRVPFDSEDGEHHNLYFAGEGTSAQLTVASEPMSFPAFLDAQEAGASATRRQKIAQARTKYAQLLEQQRIAGAGTSAAGGAGGSSATGAAGPSEAASQRVTDLTNELADLARQIMGGGAGASTAPQYGGLVGGMGQSVSVARLTPVHPSGSEPSVGGGWWTALTRRRHGGSTYYIMGHLINHHLGGPGNTWANLTPLTRSTNSSMSSSFEEHAKRRVHDDHVPVDFQVTATFGRSPRTAEQAELRSSGNPDDAVVADIIQAEQFVPLSINGHANDLTEGAPGSKVPPLGLTNTIEETATEYDLDGAPRQPAYLSDMSESELMRLPGVKAPLAARLRAGQPFRTQSQVNSIPGANWDALVATTAFRLRLYRRG
jgi:hypothetical protein